jgi:DNA mismatch repair protein PMS2
MIPNSRSKGTSVKIDSLFHNLPVRKQELKRNQTAELSKCINLLHAYVLGNTLVRFKVTNRTKKGLETIICSQITDNILISIKNLFKPDLSFNLIRADQCRLSYSQNSKLTLSGVISKYFN